MSRRRGLAAIAVAAAILTIAGLRGRLRRYEIVEDSMRPELRPGDYLVAGRTDGPLQRGDIVIFTHPTIPTMELVKRVVGLPGEKLTIANGQVHIDGNVLAEPWADGPTRPDGEWQLATGEVFLLGDYRAASAADGRTIGPVPSNRIHWRVQARYWPWKRIGRI